MHTLRQNIYTKSQYKNFILKEDIIIKCINEDELYYIDEQLARQITIDLHLTYGHIGTRKTWMVFRENYFAKNDIKIVKDIIRSCHICSLGKYKNFKNQNTVESTRVTDRLEIIAIDYLSNLIPDRWGNKNILVVYDLFTKYIKLYPTKRCTTDTTIKCLIDFIQRYDKPGKILGDNASYFNNEKFIKYWENREIQTIFTTIRRPQANASERLIEEVIKFLRLVVDEDHDTWTEHLPDIETYINHIPNTITQISPITLMTQQLPDRPWYIDKNIDYQNLHDMAKLKIQKNSQKYIARENKKIRKRTRFKTGDMVIVKKLRVSDWSKNKCAKFLLPYEGPYIISKTIGENTYELKYPEIDKIRGKFHIEMLYKYNPQEVINQTNDD